MILSTARALIGARLVAIELALQVVRASTLERSSSAVICSASKSTNRPITTPRFGIRAGASYARQSVPLRLACCADPAHMADRQMAVIVGLEANAAALRLGALQDLADRDTGCTAGTARVERNRCSEAQRNIPMRSR